MTISQSSTDRPDEDSAVNPFPGTDTKVWTTRFSHALSTATGLPLIITDAIAVGVVRPKRYLPRRNGMYTLRPDCLTHDQATGLLVLEVETHGFIGTPGEFNERIRRSYTSVLRPDADPEQTLPQLTTLDIDGIKVSAMTTTDSVDVNRQSALLEKMERALDETDGERGYRLDEDMQAYGQIEPTLHAVLFRRIRQPGRVRTLVDLTAIRGANRSRARLKSHGLTVSDVIFGLQPETLGLPSHIGDVEKPRIADPAQWVPLFASEMHSAYTDPTHRLYETAQKAAKIAVVPTHIVVGVAAETVPATFHTDVFRPNRTDHRRPPLDYVLGEKSAADLRSLLGELASEGWFDEATRAWLAGEGPDSAAVPGESYLDARDRRDRTLLNIVFPEDRALRAVVRRVLGEPAAHEAQQRHVWQRTRMFSALVSDTYTGRWNPRVLDGLLPASAIKDRISYEGWGTWQEILKDAERQAVQGGPGPEADALLAFLITRGFHWLAEHDLINADRGSVGAQNTIHEAEAEEQAAKKIRRGMANIRNALLAQPARTVALMRELARASEASVKGTATAPRKVDASGNPQDGTGATKAWFDHEFTKESGGRTAQSVRKDNASATDATPPVQPRPTPSQVLLERRLAYFEAHATGLPEAIVRAFESARDLAEAATELGRPGLHGASEDEVDALRDVLMKARNDVNRLKGFTVDFTQGQPDHEDLDTSETEAFLNDAASAPEEE